MTPTSDRTPRQRPARARVGFLQASLIALLLSSLLAACSGSATAPATLTTVAGDQPTAPATSAPATAEATAATSDPTTAPAATAATGDAPADEKALRAELQNTMDQWAKAMEQNSPEEMRKAVDQTNLNVRRIHETRMKQVAGRPGAADTNWHGDVGTIRQRPNGYVQANVDINGSRWTFVFKQVKGVWQITEPRRAELGTRKKIETEHFVFQYYDWDGDIAQQLVDMMEEIHVRDVQKLGEEPTQPATVNLVPTAEVTPGGGRAGVLAFYAGRARIDAPPLMVINSPNSFEFYNYDPDKGWEADLEVTLAHEYVHLLNDCCTPTKLARQNAWMTEGLAVYISEGGYENGYTPLVRSKVQSDDLLPIIAPSDKPGAIRRDLESFNALEDNTDVVLGYGQGAALVAYIVDTYGGLEGYWKLIGAYDESQDFPASVQQVLGISLEDFEKGYQAELKKRYQ